MHPMAAGHRQSCDDINTADCDTLLTGWHLTKAWYPCREQRPKTHACSCCCLPKYEGMCMHADH